MTLGSRPLVSVPLVFVEPVPPPPMLDAPNDAVIDLVYLIEIEAFPLPEAS